MGKRYKCPYCDKRDERSNLISHIKRSHKELIPEGFSAERVVYNSVNKVSCGRCRICGKETLWNQKAGRYDVLCGDPKCKEHMREEYKKNMLRVRGTYNILNDPEQQTKMLANRKISGSYKFSDGGVVSYTGSYEKKCLEFMDVVMQIPSKDILSPGPTLEYEYNGKKHFYISDFYYIPYNLIIEVKDGGEDPNTKDSTSMRASREKTLAKEKIITDRGEYNYLRLTNNNFSQLIEIFMDIKLKLLEGDTSKTYKINESAMLEVFSYPCELSSKGTGAIHPMLKIFVESMRKRYNTKTKNIDIIFLKSYQTLANTINKYEDVFQFKNDFMVRVKDTIYIVDPVIFTSRNSSTRYYAGETETYYAVLRWQLCNILLTEYTDINNLRTINAISMYEAGINSDNYTLSSAQVRDLNKIKRIAEIDGYKSLPAIASNRKSIVESAITEGVLIDKKDIYYNKQAFDDGRINLCFITGHSGSGKTTMAKNMPADMVELDDVVHNYRFSDDNLKEYCDLIYSFFNGVGKKYRVHSLDEFLKADDDYEEKIIRDFARYAIAYANSHKDKKFVLEGIWIYLYIKPSELDNYAVYIKGTSAIKSRIRAANRDNDKIKNKLYQCLVDGKKYTNGEPKINAYRKYFEHKKSSI